MNDGRRRRQAKQARRDARRTRARAEEAPAETAAETPEETHLVEEVRQALATGHPLDLLGIVSLLIEATKPDPLAYLKSRESQPDPVSLDDLIAGFVGVQIPETTALLTVLAELLVDDDLQLRCRQEVDARHDSLPTWLSDLSHVEVYRAMRMTHVLGDGDELLIGARLAGGHELTCAVHIDHLMMSRVKDAFFVPAPIEQVISVAAEQNTDPDTSFAEMSLADARAWIEQGLGLHPIFTAESDSWPGCRPLVQWLTGRMPQGGQRHLGPTSDSDEVCDQFFASPAGAPFGDYEYRHLLFALVETGTGDPLRWSAARIEQALGSELDADHDAGEAVLAVPELLRAFVPFAHAQSGIREELTAEALAVIDEIGPGYKEKVLDNPKYWDDSGDD
jgi:hypothetical protein